MKDSTILKRSLLKNLVVATTLGLLAITPLPVKASGNRQAAYIQALVDHHIQILPSNIERDRDIRCLALNIYYESRGEPILGQLAVANVTINRVSNSRKTICETIYSPGQFEWTSNKRLRPPAGDSWKQSLTIAWLVITQPETVFDVTKNAEYFHSFKRTPPSWRGREHTATIGNHRFYRDRPHEEIAVSPER